MSVESIHIKQTPHSPEIIIDPEKKIFKISGRSLPEEVMDVYHSVLDWVDKNGAQVVTENYNVSINLFYFNSPTARVLHKILKKLDSEYSNQPDFSVNWHYENEEDLEDAQDLLDEIKIPVNYIKTPDNLLDS